jgi:hypothetical protein
VLKRSESCASAFRSISSLDFGRWETGGLSFKEWRMADQVLIVAQDNFHKDLLQKAFSPQFGANTLVVLMGELFPITQSFSAAILFWPIPGVSLDMEAANYFDYVRSKVVTGGVIEFWSPEPKDGRLAAIDREA